MMKTQERAPDIRERKAFHVEPVTDDNGARVFVVRRCYGDRDEDDKDSKEQKT